MFRNKYSKSIRIEQYTNRQYVRKMYVELLDGYKKLKEGEKTEYGTVLTPRLIITLENRLATLCTRQYP